MKEENLLGNSHSSWITQEQQRLAKKPVTIQAQSGPRRPSVAEVALSQLKRDATEGRQIKTDPTATPDHIAWPGKLTNKTVEKVIEKIKSI